jgi:hypothetical protein
MRTPRRDVARAVQRARRRLTFYLRLRDVKEPVVSVA